LGKRGIVQAEMPVLAQRGCVTRRLSPLALMPVAAFAVHQLRYWLAFGGQAHVELQRQGHSYLHSVVPWLVVLIALAIGAFLRALGRAFGGQRSLSRYTVSFAVLWLLCAVGLVAIYVAQESLEGLFAIGHPGGLEGIFGFGGWWSIPAAVAVGLVLAAAFHGARWMLDEVSARCGRRGAPATRRATPVHLPRAIVVPRLAPLADGWSGRGPPR
jgi:hypothetical protein